MKRGGTQPCTTFQGIYANRPTMAVRRCKDCRLEVEAKIVPKAVRHVKISRRAATQEILQSVRLSRIEEGEETALILAETTPRQGAEQAGRQRMQGPAAC